MIIKNLIYIILILISLVITYETGNTGQNYVLDSHEIFLKNGISSYKNLEFKKALDKFQKCAGISENQIEPYFYIFAVNIKLGRYEDAASAIETAVHIRTNELLNNYNAASGFKNIKFPAYTGEVSIDLNYMINDIECDLIKSILTGSNSFYILLNLAYLKYFKENYDDAANYFKITITQKKIPELYFYAAFSSFRLNDFKSSDEYIKTYLQFEPENAGAIFIHALNSYNLKNVAEAEKSKNTLKLIDTKLFNNFIDIIK